MRGTGPPEGSCEARCAAACCGRGRGPARGPHARLLWFGATAPDAIGFLLTFLGLVNAVYGSVVLGVLSVAFVLYLGVALGLVAVLGMLTPSFVFMGMLAGVVADYSMVVSTEDMVRKEIVREAVAQQQAALAASAVRVLACLASSDALKRASRLTASQRAARLAAAQAALGPEALREALTEAEHMFRSFLPPGHEELDRAALLNLLRSLGLVGDDATTAEEAEAVGQVLAAMDEDSAGAAAEGERGDLLASATISLEEFQHWYVAFGPAAPISAAEDLDALAEDVFRALDTDKSGDVSLAELRAVLSGIDSSIDVEAVLAAWDSDRSGSITVDELKQVFQDSLR